jgi:hypothetical protein
VAGDVGCVVRPFSTRRQAQAAFAAWLCSEAFRRWRTGSGRRIASS